MDSGLPPVPPGIAHRVVAASFSPWRSLVGDAGVAALCREQAPDLIQTLGIAPHLAPVWPALASSRAPIVHAVAAGGPVTDGHDELLDPCNRIRPALRSLPGMMARHASRHVSALIGSNRRDIGRHRELGFFPASRFSVVAGIPVQLDGSRHRAVPPPPWPRFGYFNPDHTPASWSFVRDALAMIGSSSYTLAVAPGSGSGDGTGPQTAMRFAHVVAMLSDPMLARLTLEFIGLQQRPPDLVVLVADSRHQHAFGPSALAPRLPEVEHVYLPAASYGSAAPGALHLEGLRTVAARADVAIFCREGLLFRPDHLHAVEQAFDASADLVGLLETAGDIVDLDVTGPAPTAAAILAAPRRPRRRA